jgi:hypothetical protein
MTTLKFFAVSSLPAGRRDGLPRPTLGDLVLNASLPSSPPASDHARSGDVLSPASKWLPAAKLQSAHIGMVAAERGQGHSSKWIETRNVPFASGRRRIRGYASPGRHAA